MAFLNAFDVDTTRRISLGLMAAAGALFFKAADLVAAGISAGDKTFAHEASAAIFPLMGAAFVGLVCFIWAEIAAHPGTPDTGHPHSRPNYLQSAFALIAIYGLGSLAYGTARLVAAATVE